MKGSNFRLVLMSHGNVHFFLSQQHKFDQFCYHNEPKDKEDKLLALRPDFEESFPLIATEDVSPDVQRFRFGLPSKDHRLGLPIGHHIFIYAKLRKHTHLHRCVAIE